MATQKELYISFSPEVYRHNKATLLQSQADFLRILKNLNNLQIYLRRKNELRTNLYKLISSTSSEIISLKSKLPTPELPKSIKRRKTQAKKTVKEKKYKKELSKNESIERELKEIQEKLRELNS